MNILIIGGTGNISTAIVEGLRQQGAEVTLFHRSETGPEGVRAICGDRTNYAEFQARLAGEPTWDCVIDMIGYEPGDAASAVETFRGRTKQFIFCSTVDVFTKTPHCYPVTEENGVISALPGFPYAHKKVECERILWEAHRRGDFVLTILRPAATYNDTWSPAVHTFGGQTYHLDRIRKGKPILLHGDGTSIWVAAHRDDVAVPFVNAVLNPAAYGRHFNVAGDEWMTHNEMWRTVARVMGAPQPDFVYIPTEILARLAPEQAEWCRENFRHNNIFDCSLAKKELGFRYTIMYEQGVARSVDYLSRNDKIESCDNHPFYDRIVEAWRSHNEAVAAEFQSNPL